MVGKGKCLRARRSRLGLNGVRFSLWSSADSLERLLAVMTFNAIVLLAENFWGSSGHLHVPILMLLSQRPLRPKHYGLGRHLMSEGRFYGHFKGLWFYDTGGDVIRALTDTAGIFWQTRMQLSKRPASTLGRLVWMPPWEKFL